MAVLHESAASMSSPLQGAADTAPCGRVGILSQSGTLAAQAAGQTAALSLGASSVIEFAADAPGRTDLMAALREMLADRATKAVVLILDQDGRPSEALLQMLEIMTPHKPVVAYVEGFSSTGGGSSEDAGDIVSFSNRSRSRQASALRAAGAIVVEHAGDFGVSVLAVLNSRGKRSTTSPWSGQWQSDFASTMRLVEQEVYGP